MNRKACIWLVSAAAIFCVLSTEGFAAANNETKGGFAKNILYCADVSHAASERSDDYNCKLQNDFEPVVDKKNSQGYAVKKVITPSDYVRWNRIVNPKLSNDGAWVVYTLMSTSGNYDLVAQNFRRRIEYRFHRGKLEKPIGPGDPTSYYTGPKLANITHDSHHVVFSINDKTYENSAANSLGVIDLRSGAAQVIRGVVDHVLPQHSSKYIVYTQGPPLASTGVGVSAESILPTLVLRDLNSSEEVKIHGVRDFVIDDYGRYIAYTLKANTLSENGVHLIRLSDGAVIALKTGAGRYESLELDKNGERLAFLFAKETKDKNPLYSIYYSDLSTLITKRVVPETAFWPDLVIAQSEGVRFSEAGNALVFSLTPRTHDAGLAEASVSGARFDLLRWQDPLLMSPRPRRMLQASKPADLRRFYVAVYHIAQRRWVQLGSAFNSDILLTNDARHAIGINEAPYPKHLLGGADGIWIADLSLIDALSGDVRSIRRKVQPALQMGRAPCPMRGFECLKYFSLSSQSRYLVYFADRRWWSLDLANDSLVDLTGALSAEGLGFRSNGPDRPISHEARFTVPSVAGWLANDERMLLYDSYDIWEIDPSGVAPARNLTNGFGRREHIVFRLWEHGDNAHQVTVGPRLESSNFPVRVDESKPLLLVGVDKDTMASGIWSQSFDEDSDPESLLMADKRVRAVARTDGDTHFLLTMETFEEYPDLWVGAKLDGMSRISNANPQQSEYLWGSAELVEFISDFGSPLKGVLYKPDDFDPRRKYPMIVSFYEVSSNVYHQYAPPEPLSTAPSGLFLAPELFTSKDFIVYVPDVVPIVPYPAQSSLASVVPAVQLMIDRGHVDPDRIAISGHSFGAYEASYVITQTDMFQCAVLSSGFQNMVSNYGTSSYGTGYSEAGQLRLGASVWERPLVYVQNSPLFFADHVKAPVLLMHNPKDAAVPISQSMEFFAALQRNEKEVYLFSYHDEGHVLYGFANRLDWSSRVGEFLDHCLKGTSRPKWMGPRMH